MQIIAGSHTESQYKDDRRVNKLPDAGLVKLPQGHPEVSFGRTGILIANLGTPDSTGYRAMRRYLNEFLSDRRVIDYPRWKWQPVLQLIVLTRRPFTSGRAYRTIWNTEANESPLLTITRQQTDLLSERLEKRFGDAVRVDFCMRYGNPSVSSVLDRMLTAGCRRIVYFPLYPQYSATTTATACDQLFRALMTRNWQPSVRVVEPYFEHPGYIRALASAVEAAWSQLDFEPQLLLTSFHGLPERYLREGDPYHCHCQKTARLLCQQLGWVPDRLAVSFQSRFGPEAWLQPYTDEETIRLARAGCERLAVMAPGFAADCIETLEEIEEQIQHGFRAAGGRHFAYIPCLNASLAHIDMLEDIIVDNLAGWV